MYQLRDYQLSAVKKALLWCKNQSPENGALLVLPCGTGKSLVIAEIIAQMAGRTLVLSHVAELVEQDHQKFCELTGRKAGFYLSSKKDTFEDFPVIFATIQSAGRKPELWKTAKLIIIDEAQMVPNKDVGLFHKLFEQNHAHRIGLSATPFRADSGPLTLGPTFASVIFEYPLAQAVKDGSILPLRTLNSVNEIDASQVPLRGFDYDLKKLEGCSILPELLVAQVRESMPYLEQCQGAISFAVSVLHATALCELYKAAGFSAALLTGETSKKERRELLKNFKNRKIKILVNVLVATVGFDVPHIDLILHHRPTKSAVIWGQSLGRGTRCSPGKSHCLVLDFTNNTSFFGPLEDLNVAVQVKRATPGMAPTKMCPQCQAELPISVLTCEFCGQTWKKENRTEGMLRKPNKAQLTNMELCEKWHPIKKMIISIHKKPDKPDSIRIEYFGHDNVELASQWICPEHSGYPGQLAQKWLKEHGLLYLGAMKARDLRQFLGSCVSDWRPHEIMLGAKKPDAKYREIQQERRSEAHPRNETDPSESWDRQPRGSTPLAQPTFRG